MSLVSLCIQSLVPFPDQLHLLPVKLHLRSRELIDLLIPDPANIDPRLWAVLVQIYTSLPPFLASHSLPLAHTHLPLLQSIPSTPSFSLITLLDLPQVTDGTIFQLRFINTLTAFNATQSPLSPLAIKTLASFKSLWQLRILSLRNCRLITNDVFPHLEKFPLLSVLDLRGTRCNTDNLSLPFQPSSHHRLYYPTPLKSALTTLQALHTNLYSSSNPYYLHVHGNPRPRVATVTPQNAFFVVPSDNSKIQVGSSHLLEERERELIHQRNKDAWYERHDRLESHTNYSMDPVLTRRPPRLVGSLVEKSIPSTSHITRSSWIGKNDPPKQIKPRHSLPLPSKAPPASTPRANDASSISAKSFYNPPPPPKRTPSLPSQTRSSDNNQSLKLYRPAPPWSTLNDHLTQVQMEETAAIERQEQYTRTIPPEEEIARIDMSSTKVTLMKRQLDEWTLAQTQMRMDEKEKTDVRVVDGETSLLSRNAFRRQQGATKPLKPISTVKVPILTPQVRKAALAREEIVNLKRKWITAEEQEDGEELNSILKRGRRPKSVAGIKATSRSSGFNWNAWAKNAS